MLADAYRFAPAAPEEDVVHGACCPGWHTAATHEQALDEWVARMREAGIERVCCLLPGRQLDAHDANLDRYREVFGPNGVLHAPIPDHSYVDGEVLREHVLPFLADADAAGEAVVVHCLAGIGRTGHVLAAWLVHGRDYGPHEAVKTVSEMGRDPLAPVERGEETPGELLELLDAVA